MYRPGGAASSRRAQLLELAAHQQKILRQNQLADPFGAGIWQNGTIRLKMVLTIREAAEYSNIGINQIDSMLKQPNRPIVPYAGTRKLVKRREFEEYISGRLVIYA